MDQNQTVLDKHGAMIDKFTGSTCLAVFREKYVIQSPLNASEEILNLTKQSDLNVNICIGLATGKAMLGHVGSFRRKDYTCIGDTVNLAARLGNFISFEKSTIESYLFRQKYISKS